MRELFYHFNQIYELNYSIDLLIAIEYLLLKCIYLFLFFINKKKGNKKMCQRKLWQYLLIVLVHVDTW